MSDVCLVCSRAEPAHAQEGAVQHHVCQPSGSGPPFKQASGLPDTAGDAAAGPAGALDGVLQGQIQASPFLEAAEGVGAGAGCIVGPGQLACLSWPAALLRKHCRLLLTLPKHSICGLRILAACRALVRCSGLWETIGSRCLHRTACAAVQKAASQVCVLQAAEAASKDASTPSASAGHPSLPSYPSVASATSSLHSVRLSSGMCVMDLCVGGTFTESLWPMPDCHGAAVSTADLYDC